MENRKTNRQLAVGSSVIFSMALQILLKTLNGGGASGFTMNANGRPMRIWQKRQSNE